MAPPLWARAIDSVLVQEFKPGFEIIVVNDGSTDCTAQILAGYENDIRIVKHNNRGPAAARNTGATNAEGEFLAFLDADDFWEPVMLENTVRALRCNPAAVLAYCNAATFDPGGWLVTSSLVASDRNHPPSMAELLTRWWPGVAQRGDDPKARLRGVWRVRRGSTRLRGRSFLSARA